MSLKEKIGFGLIEVSSYSLIGFGFFYFHNLLMGWAGIALLGVTLLWFSKLAKRVGLRIFFKGE